MNSPRSLDYYIWRVSERFGFEPGKFIDQDYEAQLTLLSYEMLRQQEETILARSETT